MRLQLQQTEQREQELRGKLKEVRSELSNRERQLDVCQRMLGRVQGDKVAAEVSFSIIRMLSLSGYAHRILAFMSTVANVDQLYNAHTSCVYGVQAAVQSGKQEARKLEQRLSVAEAGEGPGGAAGRYKAQAVALRERVSEQEAALLAAEEARQAAQREVSRELRAIAFVQVAQQSR